MNTKQFLNRVIQFIIPGLTICSQIAIALRYPEYGLALNLLIQPFWIYSSWKAYKEAGQIGLFITSLIITVVMFIGVVNYWFI